MQNGEEEKDLVASVSGPASPAASSSASAPAIVQAQTNAKVNEALASAGPKIRSTVGDKKLTGDDALIAECRTTCTNKLEAINKELDERAKHRNKLGQDAPQNLETMFKIMFMGSPFPFLQDSDLYIKKWFYEDKLDKLNDQSAPIREKLEAVESVENYNKASEVADGMINHASKKLDQWGVVGKGAKLLCQAVGGLSRITGVSAVLSNTADLVGGVALGAYSTIKGLVSSPAPKLAVKPEDPSSSTSGPSAAP